MNIRRRAPLPPTPLKTTASVDTIELFLRIPPRGLRSRIERVIGRRCQIEELVDRTGHRQGVRVIFNKPTLDVLAIIAEINRAERQSAISRVDFAFDFYVEGADEEDALADWIDQYVVLKWRSARTRKIYYGTTVYWCDGHKGRNLVLYRKRPGVVRMEMRFYRAASVRRAGLNDLAELPTINPQRLFDHHVNAMRFTERYKVKVMREAVAQDRNRTATTVERRRSKRTQQFVDRYRASIPRRARYVLEQVDAQNIGGRRGTEKVSLDFLGIPDCLTWPPLKTKRNSKEIAKVGGYYGGEATT